MIRRIFAFVLAFFMLISSVPTEALATMIHVDSAAEALAAIISEELSAPAETTEAVLNTTAPTVTETTVGETVPETTAGETIPETTVEETVPATTEGETVPETTEETVPETTVEETIGETQGHVHGESCYDAEGTLICEEQSLTDGAITDIAALAVTEPELTDSWAADALAMAQAYFDGGYSQETDADGNPYTVFGTHFGDAAATDWNAYFVAYCIAKANEDADQTFVPMPESGLAADWVADLTSAGLYQTKASGYTPEAGDLVFWTNYWPQVQHVGIIASVTDGGWTKNIQILLADDSGNSLDGKVGLFSTNINDGRINGYARIPSLEGTMEQTLTAKAYTDDTFATEDPSVTAVVEGELPVNAEIRVYPVTLTDEQTTALTAIGDVAAAYGVKIFVNGAEYTGTVNAPVSVKITSDTFGTGAAMLPYGLADMQKIAASLSGSTLSLNVNIPTSFALVGVSSTTVTTAAELKAAVEMGVPEITLGADITVDAENDNMTVSKAVKIDLNGKTLTAAGDDPLFVIADGGELTMDDTGNATETKSEGTLLALPDSVDDAALGSVAKGDNGKAVLTYYTTKSVDAVPSVTYDNGATNEYRYTHTVSAAGMIQGNEQDIFHVNGGTLNINDGVYCGTTEYTDKVLGEGLTVTVLKDTGRGILQSGGTTNLNGGYFCGFGYPTDNFFWLTENHAGGAIRSTGGSLNINGAVIAANQAISGAGVYASGTSVNMTSGVISGNKAYGISDPTKSDAGGGPFLGGAGVYLGENSRFKMSGSSTYITNNSAPDASAYADGGGAIFAKKWTSITIDGGYVTSNTVGGGGGAIRTIYGTETNYANMTSDEVRAAVEMSIDINGGYICGNFCRYAEGGGVSVNAGTGCWLTGGYINNNVTMTQRDWGGGGLFNANGSYLDLKNVLITENTALGLGGGVGGCSTGDIHLAVTEGGALFDNTAKAQNWSGEGSQKREDTELAKDNPNFDLENADDYFCVHNSKVEAQMLGRGSCDWVGTCDDARVTPPQRTVLEATEVMGLTSYAMAPGKKEARMNAVAYINGNYSNVHGGGIMCNGVLDVGTPMEGPLPAWLEVVGTKVFESSTPLISNQFTFEIWTDPVTGGDPVTTGTNDDAGKIAFGKQLVFVNAGEYKYIIKEQAGVDETIKYDDAEYKMVVTTVTDADGNICIDSVTINGDPVEIAEGSFYVTLPVETITFTNSGTENETTSFTVTKVWEDNGNQDGKQPNEITVQLYADGVAYGPTVKLNISNQWSYRWDPLPKYKDVNGNRGEIQYTVDEINVPEGYTKSINGGTITNTHEIEKTDLSVKKDWKDFDNQDGKRPAGVVVALYSNETTPVAEAILNAANGWTHTWTDLDVYAGGNRITYSVVEIAHIDASGKRIEGIPAGYTVTHTYANGVQSREEKVPEIWTEATVTNSLTPELTTLNVQKEWSDNNNQDGIRPERITLTLWKTTTKPSKTVTVNGHEHYVVDPGVGSGWVKAVDAKGNPYVLTMTPAESGAWDADFVDLPKYEAGKLIYYAVTEEAVAGYTSSAELDPDTNVLYLKNTHETEKTKISVSKTWNDVNDQDGIRPASITVSLYGRVKTSPLETITLPDANGNWSYTWTGLDKYYNGQPINYTVAETAVPGYNLDSQGNAQNVIAAPDGSGNIVLTNTHVPELVDIPVTKTWDDADDQDDKRPDTITVVLLADGAEVRRQTISAAENWSWTFEDLPKFKNGAEIVYSVDEITVPGYETIIDGFSITNRHETELTSVTATKIWKDNNDQDGLRPASIKLHLLANGTHTGQVVELKPDANGDWSYTWNDLPKYADGVEIDYALMEEAVGNGYYTTIDGYTVTNTYAPEKTAVNVWKNWDDGNNQDNLRPASITVTLYADGVSTGKTLTLNAAGHWYGSFSGLDKFKDGKTIAYTVKETAVAGYEPGTVSGSMEEGFTITNKRDVEKTQISVTKVWEDSNDQDGLRPESVTVTLYRDGVATDKSVELSEANNWTYTWKELDVHHSQGTDYVYSVVETVPDGYEAITTGSAATGYVITNKRDTDTTSIPVVKVWNDERNQDGVRPASITVELLADGQKTGKTLTLTAAVNWQGIFTDLPVNNEKTDSAAEAKSIVYTVREIAVEGYESAVSGSMADGFTITNTHEVEVTRLNVRKVWADFNDTDGKRPYAVVITLHENGKLTDKTLILSNENGWKGAWDNMPRYSGGTWIAYSVVETGFYQTAEDLEKGNLTLGVPSGYEVSHSYDSTDTSNPVATVTNTYAPETVGLNVQKRWNDDNDREGLRPTEITVTLYRKVGETGTWNVVKDSDGNDMTVVLSEANQWDADFLGLPKYSNGQLVYYNVVETPVEGYEEPDYLLDPATGVVTITNSHPVSRDVEIAVSKIWDDQNDQDGLRPDDIVVTLYANGIRTSSTKTLNASNGWKAEWTGLYEYYKGSKIIYTVVEENIPAGYEAIVTGDASTGFVITNSRAAEKISLTVNKVWADGEHADSARPIRIHVTLLKNGTEVETVTLNQENNWSYTWNGLYKYAGGEEVNYTVRETAIGAYTADYTYTTSADGKTIIATVTNTYTPVSKWFTIRKVWNDNDNAEGKRSAAVTIQIYKNGEAYGDPIVLSAANNWQSPVLLPVYENGVEIKWTVKEINIPRYYSVSYDQNTLTITNTIQSKEVPKTGDDNNLLMWVGLLGLCGAGAAIVLFIDKKKKRGK